MIRRSEVDLALSVSDLPIEELLAVARTADELGYGCLWLAEGVGPDVFSTLTRVATNTDRLELGTGIVNVYTRTPTTIALAADTVLTALGDRRFHLGLGASGKGLIEKFHGIPHDRAIARVRDAVRIVDSVFATGQLPEGVETFALQPGLAIPVDAGRDRLRILVASLGPRSVQMTGEVADGWLPIWLSTSRGQSRLDQVVNAAAAAGRPRPTVAAYIYAVVSESPEDIGHLRSTLAWYIAANGTAYARLFRDYGYTDEVDAITGRWAADDRAGAKGAVGDALLADCTLAGDPEVVRAGLQRFRAFGVDRPVLRFPRQLSAADCIHMLERLAPALDEEAA